jgi:hypothetical protein
LVNTVNVGTNEKKQSLSCTDVVSGPGTININGRLCGLLYDVAYYPRASTDIVPTFWLFVEQLSI